MTRSTSATPSNDSTRASRTRQGWLRPPQRTACTTFWTRSSCTCARRARDRRRWRSAGPARAVTWRGQTAEGGLMGRFPGEDSCLTLVWAVLDLLITHQTNGIRFGSSTANGSTAPDITNPTTRSRGTSSPGDESPKNLSRGRRGPGERTLAGPRAKRRGGMRTSGRVGVKRGCRPRSNRYTQPPCLPPDRARRGDTVLGSGDAWSTGEAWRSWRTGWVSRSPHRSPA